MSTVSDVFRAWLRDHPVDDDADVAAAAARGHRLFLRWLVLRTVVAVIAGTVLVTGLLQMRSLALGSPIFSTGPKASLVVDPATGAEPLKVTADASTSSPGAGSAITSVRFDFGDGTIKGPQPDPIVRHTYEDAGTYTVTVTVAEADGRSDQASATVTVDARSQGSPRASLEVSPPQGTAPLKVVADASGSSPGTGARIERYRFDFGDGSPRRSQRKPVARHVYKKAGSHQLSLRVVDSDGDADESSEVVTVTPRPRPLEAALVVTPRRGTAPLDVEVDASASSPATGASIVSYQFDFGDGSAGEPLPDPRARHTYQASGTYTVTVTVTDSAGDTDRAKETVKVAERKPTDAELAVKPEQGSAPLSVQADASRSSPAADASIVSYQFDFGDGGAGEPQSDPGASHTYKEAGQYTVTVTVTDSNGDTSQGSRTVTVT